jgi:hypothetical protein
MDSDAKYLLSLNAVRDRAKIVGEAADAGKLRHFDVHEDRLSDVADLVVSVIKVRLCDMIWLFEELCEADDNPSARLRPRQVRHYSTARKMAAFRSRWRTSHC